MLKKICLKLKNEKGQTTVEYLLVTTFLVVVFAFMYKYIGVYLRGSFSAAAGIILKVYS